MLLKIIKDLLIQIKIPKQKIPIQLDRNYKIHTIYLIQLNFTKALPKLIKRLKAKKN
jgi:hypothetical protein